MKDYHGMVISFGCIPNRTEVISRLGNELQQWLAIEVRAEVGQPKLYLPQCYAIPLFQQAQQIGLAEHDKAGPR